MIKRIELIMQTQNLGPSQFADKIGIQRPVLSHVLSGRNNPSLDFVMKVLAAFPQIEPNWFLLGKGKMYVNLAEPKEEEARMVEPAPERIFEPVPDPVPELVPDPVPDPVSQPEALPVIEPVFEPASDSVPAPFETEKEPCNNPGQSKVEKIVIFYSDGSFSEYRPQ